MLASELLLIFLGENNNETGYRITQYINNTTNDCLRKGRKLQFIKLINGGRAKYAFKGAKGHTV